MILRKTRQGARAGQGFWDCSRFPKCRGIVSELKPFDEDMFVPHLIETVRNRSITDAIRDLVQAHSQVVSCVHRSQTECLDEERHWGASMKRLVVDLEGCDGMIGKTEEKFVEVINILATTERTIAALVFFEGVFPGSRVQECHPSTSDDIDGNDIVLVNRHQKVIVRCEVCDVVSPKPGQNGKEKKDLNSLGVSDAIPSDGVKRFIATSPEFASGLISENRVWKDKLYRYIAHSTECVDGTIVLEVVHSERM